MRALGKIIALFSFLCFLALLLSIIVKIFQIRGLDNHEEIHTLRLFAALELIFAFIAISISIFAYRFSRYHQKENKEND